MSQLGFAATFYDHLIRYCNLFSYIYYISSDEHHHHYHHHPTMFFFLVPILAFATIT